MPVTVLVATGDTHVAHVVQRHRAVIVTDDGMTHEVSNDHARALLLAIETSASFYVSPEGMVGMDVPAVEPGADLDAARAELMRAQAAKAMAEARAIFRGDGIDATPVTPANIQAAFAEAMAQARPLLREFEPDESPAFPLTAKQIVNLLAETIRVVLDETARPPIPRYGRFVTIVDRLMVAAGLDRADAKHVALSDFDHDRHAPDSGGAA